MSSLASCTLHDRRYKHRLARRNALIAALLAVALFNPWTFGMVNGLSASLFGKPNLIATGRGRPTAVGLIVHAVVLFLIGMIIYYYNQNPSEPTKVCCDAAALQVHA